MEQWRARINIEGKAKHFGYFDEEEGARIAVNKAYAKHFPDNPELQQKTRQKAVLETNNIICKKWR